MTEAEWLAGAESGLWRGVRLAADVPSVLHGLDDAGESLWSMLRWAKVRLLEDGRKYRLFACACCRLRFPQAPPDKAVVNAIDWAERYADHLTTAERKRSVHRQMQDRLRTFPDWRNGRKNRRLEWAEAAMYALDESGEIAAYRTANAVLLMAANRGDELQRMCAVLRDIVFKPAGTMPTITPTWISRDVLGVAQSIYDERAFDHLPILADALEDVRRATG